MADSDDFKSVYERLKKKRDRLYKKKPIPKPDYTVHPVAQASFNPPIPPRSMGTWTPDGEFEHNRVIRNEEARTRRKRGRKPGSRNRRTDNGTTDNDSQK